METLVFETALGHTALARRGNRLLALTFGHPRELPAVRSLETTLSLGSESFGSETVQIGFDEVEFVLPGSYEFVDRLCAFIAGEEVDFDDLEIDCSHLTSFGCKVVAACRCIPWGQKLTYSQLAEQAGRPGAARAVGSVMASNRLPLIVPCHRVVPAYGGRGGFSAPQCVAMKKRLLQMEKQSDAILL